MAERNDFMQGWMSGWAAATSALTQSLQQALQGTGRVREMRIAQSALAETAGDKPMSVPRRRGRPPKSATTPTRRRRGRPPKKAKGSQSRPPRKRGRPRKAAAI